MAKMGAMEADCRQDRRGIYERRIHEIGVRGRTYVTYLLKNTEETGNLWSHNLSMSLKGLNHAGRMLKKYKENHLLFIYDFRIHYSDNMSEKDLRICKNRQKMAGGFRKASRRQTSS